MIADQGANVKRAFRDERECDNSDELIELAKNMLEEQRKIDLKKKQDDLRLQLENEIENAHAKQVDCDKTRKRKRSDVLNELFDDEYEYDFTDTVSDDDSLLDADEIQDLVPNFIFSNEISKLKLTFLPSNII